MSQGTAIQFLCAGCGQMVPDATGLTAEDGIDSGLTLKCPECSQSTIIDLFAPEERKELYKARENMHFLPKFALRALLDPDGRNPATMERARAKVREWLAETS